MWLSPGDEGSSHSRKETEPTFICLFLSPKELRLILIDQIYFSRVSGDGWAALRLRMVMDVGKLRHPSIQKMGTK